VKASAYNPTEERIVFNPALHLASSFQANSRDIPQNFRENTDHIANGTTIANVTFAKGSPLVVCRLLQVDHPPVDHEIC
jgi:hypothetical protein